MLLLKSVNYPNFEFLAIIVIYLTLIPTLNTITSGFGQYLYSVFSEFTTFYPKIVKKTQQLQGSVTVSVNTGKALDSTHCGRLVVLPAVLSIFTVHCCTNAGRKITCT